MNKGMMASELVKELQRMIDEYGDLPVGLDADHEPPLGVVYDPEGWIDDPKNIQPIFEIWG